MSLTWNDRAILDLEREWWQGAQTKKDAIRTRLSCSPATYYAALRRLASSAEAFSYDPLVVARLRRRHRHQRSVTMAPGAASRHRPR